MTIHQSNVAYPSYSTTLQLDCIPSALAAREVRDSRKTLVTPTSPSLLHTPLNNRQQ